MIFKRVIAAAVSAALIASPTMAASASASAASTQAAGEIAPAAETVGEGSELRGGFIIPLIALIAIILGILAATNDDDTPNSP